MSSRPPLPSTARSATGVARRQRTNTGRTTGRSSAALSATGSLSSLYTLSPPKGPNSLIDRYTDKPSSHSEARSQSERARALAQRQKAKADHMEAHRAPEGFAGAGTAAQGILAKRGIKGVRNVKADALQRYRENKERYKMFQIPGQAAARDINPHLAQLVDFDGDGNVDAEEYALMAEVQDAELKDIDGDGVIDEDEAIVAKIELGKSILARRFVEQQAGKMWRYGKEFTDKATGDSKPDKRCASIIAADKYFGPKMNYLKAKERVFRLSGSDGMRRSLVSPITGRPLVFTPRPSALSKFL